MKNKVSLLWTLMVSVLTTLLSLGCGLVEDGDVTDPDAFDPDDVQPPEKEMIVELDIESFDPYWPSRWSAIIDNNAPVIYGGSGSYELEAMEIVYFCIEPLKAEAEVTQGIEIVPPPLCSETRCDGWYDQKHDPPEWIVDDTWDCREVVPVLDKD